MEDEFLFDMDEEDLDIDTETLIEKAESYLQSADEQSQEECESKADEEENTGGKITSEVSKSSEVLQGGLNYPCIVLTFDSLIAPVYEVLESMTGYDSNPTLKQYYESDEPLYKELYTVYLKEKQTGDIVSFGTTVLPSFQTVYSFLKEYAIIQVYLTATDCVEEAEIETILPITFDE